MVRLMNALTDKPSWDTKVPFLFLNPPLCICSFPQVFDKTTVANWKAEALATPEIDLTDCMFAYCIDELRYKSKIFQQTGIIIVYDCGVVKSDTAIPSWLRDALRTAAAPLENVPAVHRNWHPDSDEMVLDLLHPSFFPVIYGRTRILEDSLVGLDDCVKRCGEGSELMMPSYEETTIPQMPLVGPLNDKFQWLPCDVEFESGHARYVGPFPYPLLLEYSIEVGLFHTSTTYILKPINLSIRLSRKSWT